MKIKDLLIVVAIFGFIAWKIFYHPLFPSSANDILKMYVPENSSSTVSFANPCDGRKVCVYVYLASWCPHCREFISNIGQLRAFWQASDRPGLKVIVGDGKKDAIDAMASSIPSPVYLDYNNDFLHATHVRFFPYLIIVDDNERIVAQGYDAHGWIEKDVNGHTRV